MIWNFILKRDKKMKFNKLLEARRIIPKSFKLANGIKVEFVTKKELLGQLSDFNFNFKNNYDVSNVTFYILTKSNTEITVSENDFQYVKPSDVKSIFMVYEDGYLISDIEDVEFRYTKTDTPIEWDIIQNVSKIHDDVELYFKAR